MRPRVPGSTGSSSHSQRRATAATPRQQMPPSQPGIRCCSLGCSCGRCLPACSPGKTHCREPTPLKAPLLIQQLLPQQQRKKTQQQWEPLPPPLLTALLAADSLPLEGHHVSHPHSLLAPIFHPNEIPLVHGVRVHHQSPLAVEDCSCVQALDRHHGAWLERA